MCGKPLFCLCLIETCIAICVLFEGIPLRISSMVLKMFYFLCAKGVSPAALLRTLRLHFLASSYFFYAGILFRAFLCRRVLFTVSGYIFFIVDKCRTSRASCRGTACRALFLRRRAEHRGGKLQMHLVGAPRCCALLQIMRAYFRGRGSKIVIQPVKSPLLIFYLNKQTESVIIHSVPYGNALVVQWIGR